MANRTLVRARRPVAPPGADTALGGRLSGRGSMAVAWPGGSSWPTSAGAVATPQTIAGLPAAARALNMLAGIICQLPLMDRRADGGYWDTPAVLDDPWPMCGRAEWVTYMVHSLIMLGDAIGLPADPDVNGYARQLIPIDPRTVDIHVVDGAVVYDFDLGNRNIVRLSRSDVFHAKGLMLQTDALRGIGVVTLHRVGWQAALAMQRYGSTTFSAGVPSGIVKVHLREVGKEQAQGIKDDWMAAFQDRVPAVLSELMDFTPIMWSPQDAQYLDSAKLSVADIACMFNLDPTDLDATYGSSMTYANREQRAYDRLLTSIGQLLVRIEQAFRFILPRGHAAYFDRGVLLWSDASTRATVQHAQISDGTMTINEVRKANGQPTFGSWADRSSADPAVQAEQAPPVPPAPVPPEPPANPLPGNE